MLAWNTSRKRPGTIKLPGSTPPLIHSRPVLEESFAHPNDWCLGELACFLVNKSPNDLRDSVGKEQDEPQ